MKSDRRTQVCGFPEHLSLVFAAIAIAYWLPTLIAAIKGNNLGRVLVINFLTGFTLIGWVIALVIALQRKPQPSYGYR